MFLVGLGTIIVILGVALPWATAEFPFLFTGNNVKQTVTGFDIATGKMGLLLALGNGVVGLVAASRETNRRPIGVLIIAASLVIAFMTIEFVDETVGTDLGLGAVPVSEDFEISLRAGPYVTALGSAILFVAGIALAATPSRKVADHVPRQ